MRLNGSNLRIKNGVASLTGGRTWKLSRAMSLLTMAAGLMITTMASAQRDWPMFGQNESNTASSTEENSISTKNVNRLRSKWTFETGGDVSARATVADKVAYFPDWAGNLFAVDTNNGKLIWKKQFSSYGLVNPTYARSTPAVVDGVLYIGVQQGAWMLAIDARTGALKWKTQLETVDPLAIVTSSPTVVNGIVFEGVASTQEAIAGGSGPARGSVVALNAWNGTILWKTYTTPVGYTGAGVWGSNPIVDMRRGTVYVGTGDNYSAPTDPAYLACTSAGGTASNCQSPHNLSDAIIALDVHTGKIKWSQRMQSWDQEGVTSGSDFFNLSCLYGIPGCPSPAGPDFDFGSAPNEITYSTPRGPKTIIGAGQKSGIYFAFDPDTGRVLWQTQVGPGSSLGGMEWGSATDGSRIYVAVANFYGIPWGGGSAGFFAALDPDTGKVLWKTADPNGAVDLGPLAVANGVVYAPSMGGSATAPNMLALDAATGGTLWAFPAGASVIAGATVSDGSVYWGSGYSHLGIPGMTSGKTFYAFTLGDNEQHR
jgi:polyvinyl alcohol dehydrogenase (cytochrome)